MIFRIAKDHTEPVLLYQIVDVNGCPIDLTSITEVEFSLIKQTRCEDIFLDRAAAEKSSLPNYPASMGWVIYHWSLTDTAVADYYYGRFHLKDGSNWSAFPRQLEQLEVYVERSGDECS